MHSRRVLVVDDEPEQLRVFSRMLSASGYQPIPATCAQEALALAKTAAAEAALIDISMPKINGIELLKLLRSNPSTAALPAVLMTGIAAPDSLLAAASQGLDGIVIFAKGGALPELIRHIESALTTGSERIRCGRILRRGALIADTEHHRAWIDGKEITHLPARRHELLCELMRSNSPVSRSALLTSIWNGHDNPNVVDVNILRLREDLRGHTAISIVTTPAGYQLVVPT